MFNVSRMFFEQLNTLEEISLFFVSLQNLKNRRGDELDPLFRAGLHFVDLFYSYSEQSEVQLRWVGLEERDFVVAGTEYQRFVKHITDLAPTRKHQRKVNVLIGYDVGRDIEKAMKKSDRFDYENLEVSRPVDVIIRSGGTRRLSGFLPLACQYSDFVFIDKMFPSISEDEFMQVLNDAAVVARNFGH
jgi:undecaprenyl diphosphate synthase